MIFLIVALIWAAALLPPLIRARLDANSVDSVGKFRRHLRVLESTSPAAGSLASLADSGAGSAMNMPSAWAHEARRLRVRRRRHQVVRALIASMGTTLVVGLLPHLHAVLVLHLAIDVAFVLYARSLVRLRSQVAQVPAHLMVDDAETAVMLPHPAANSQAL